MKALALTLLLALPAAAQDVPRRDAVPGGDAERGRLLIAEYGCGTCHTVPSIRGARGTVGPDLTAFGQRDFIAGALPNEPGWLVRWLISPAALSPDTAMPSMNVTAADATHMAAYLVTLRGEVPSTLGTLWHTLSRGPRSVP